MLKFVSKNAVLLGLSATLCVGLIAGVNLLTKDRIAAQTLAQKVAKLQEVLPAGTADQTMLDNCIYVEDKAVFGKDRTPIYRTQVQQQTVYVVETTAPDGYSGDITLLAAIRADATILAVRTLSHKETPGLGDKIEMQKDDWMLSFNGVQVQGLEDKRVAVRKDGGQFDQFTGATITPRAVVGAVKRAAVYLAQHPELASMPAACQAEAADQVQ
jgi:electron transport complex protein RnfG